MSADGRAGPTDARPATRSDVARLAGVSTAVVSFVVNGGPKPVSPATTQRVLAAVEQLGYRPNRTARALSLGSSHTLGLVVPDTTNPFYAEFIAQLQRASADLGYALLMTAGSGGPHAPVRAMLDLCDRQIDGLIITRSPNHDQLDDLARRAPRTPVVIIDSTTTLPGYATVGPAATTGMAALVDHLLDFHEHGGVALVIGDDVEPLTDGREAGWEDAHRRLARSPGPLARVPFTREGGYDAGLDLLGRPDRPSAIVTSSDLQASGVLRAADELGLRIPHDLAVASFDGTEEIRWSTPPLTTARQPIAEMADLAVDALVHKRPPAHQAVPMDIVFGKSCGCPQGEVRSLRRERVHAEKAEPPLTEV